ncbi:MAG TPA: hypothetical protein VFO83_05350, partial [Aggregicoccus sp.]|nr:hypothetical protein [Aggregicoccus sp.]
MSRSPLRALLLGALLPSLLCACDPDITVEALDTSEECVALLPKPPLRPALAQVEVPATALCGEATTDDFGELYVTERAASPSEPGSWHQFNRDGSYDGRLSGSGRGELAPQYDGYHALRHDLSGGSRLEVLRHGELPSSTQVDPLGRPVQRVDLAGAPELGSLTVASATTSTAGDWALSAIRHAPWGERWSAQSEVASGPAGAAPRNLAGAADLHYRSLAVWETGGALYARYLRLTGSDLGAAFPVPGVPALAPLTLQPLLDGSVALKAAGSWRTRFSFAGTPALSAPPAWLVATGDSTLALVRNRQGYAVLPPPGVSSPTCSQQV